MKNVTYNMRLSLLFVAGGGLVAPAPLFGGGPSRPPLPAPRPGQTDPGSATSLFFKAVPPLNLRRYALALDYLQAARAQKPADVRVLTAFGVVYDKLGRFDLSARYYGQAAAVEPQSKIIAADMDYSRRLQGFAAADAPPASVVAANPIEGTWHLTIGGPPQLPAEKAPAVPAGAVNTNLSPLKIAALAEAKVLRKGEAEKPAPTKAVFLTGHPLTISDASGRGDAGQSVRSYLSGL